MTCAQAIASGTFDAPEGDGPAGQEIPTLGEDGVCPICGGTAPLDPDDLDG